MQARILGAAQDLFFKKGFHNVSMRAIASRIGYSPGAIYRYFKNKKEILSVLRHEAFGDYLAQMGRLDQNKPPLERLRHDLTLYLCFALADPELFDLMFNMGPSTVALGGKWAERPRRLYKLVCEDVRACQAEGFFRGADVDTVVVTLWSAVHGYATLATKQRLEGFLPQVDVEKKGEELLDFLLEMA